MIIKKALTRIMAKITGRKCSNCNFNRGGHCAHPSESMFMKCWNSITKPGHAGKYERTVFTLKVTEEQWQSGALSESEKEQLQKIKANLREASALAKESGLMEG